MVRVVEVRALAKRWISEYSPSIPGFLGAHLGGSVSVLPADAQFQHYRDVDIYVVVDNTYKAQRQTELAYYGLLLECTYLDIGRYRSPEMVLADPLLACHLATSGILADPMGLLGNLQRSVGPEYARRHWITARCATAERRMDQAFAATEALPSIWTVQSFWIAFHHLAGLVALAHLRPPTMRTGLVLLRDLLSQRGEAALHEQVLAALGVHGLSLATVIAHLHQTAGAFDEAVKETGKAPRDRSIMGHKFLSHVRPYLLQGSQEMIKTGAHREAMWWIVLWALSAYQILLGTSDNGPAAAAFTDLLRALGLAMPGEISRRVHAARVTAQQATAVAAEVVAQSVDA
ncbi:MAG TPA: hypothetical protein VGP33_11040 [Chloroflexota bacterium]|jgi:hypothetical protein|nr:hypothetical protein [Chloroflexota bacterium]